jgi:hypothetical protein
MTATPRLTAVAAIASGTISAPAHQEAVVWTWKSAPKGGIPQG